MIHINRRSPHHILIISGGPDAKADMRFQKQSQRRYHRRAEQAGQQKSDDLFVHAGQQINGQPKQGIQSYQGNVGAGPHDGQIDRIQPAHGQNAR